MSYENPDPSPDASDSTYIVYRQLPYLPRVGGKVYRTPRVEDTEVSMSI